MEAQAQVVIVEETVAASGPNPFILFLIFVPTILIAFVIPLLATIYSKHNGKKWIFYWINIILASLILRPILNFCFGATAGAFLFLITALALIYLSSNEKADVMVQASDIALTIVNDQWQSGKEKVKGVGQQFGLIE